MNDNPLDAALEHGFAPENAGIAAVELEKRLMSSLPHIAYMVSRPRQVSNLGENLLARRDAAPRSYWRRDWQAGFWRTKIRKK